MSFTKVRTAGLETVPRGVIDNIAQNSTASAGVGTGTSELATANIAPTTTSSKILVLAGQSGSTNDTSVELEIVRRINGSDTRISGTRRISNYRDTLGSGSAASRHDSMASFCVDEPNTTGTVSYILMSDSGNGDGNSANIIAVEIA